MNVIHAGQNSSDELTSEDLTELDKQGTEETGNAANISKTANENLDTGGLQFA
jgi:hypothetical protein